MSTSHPFHRRLGQASFDQVSVKAGSASPVSDKLERPKVLVASEKWHLFPYLPGEFIKIPKKNVVDLATYVFSTSANFQYDFSSWWISILGTCIANLVLVSEGFPTPPKENSNSQVPYLLCPLNTTHPMNQITVMFDGDMAMVQFCRHKKDHRLSMFNYSNHPISRSSHHISLLRTWATFIATQPPTEKFSPYGCWFLVDESFQNDLDNSALGIYTNFPKLYGWVWFRGSTKSHSKSWSSEIPQLQVTSEEPLYIWFTKMKKKPGRGDFYWSGKPSWPQLPVTVTSFLDRRFLVK